MPGWRRLPPGYAPEYASNRGSVLLRPAIVEALEKAKLEDFSLSTVRAADILRAASDIAYSDPIHAYDEKGNLLDIRQMPAHTRRAIQSIKVRRENLGTADGKTDSVVEIRFWPKQDGLELLAKHKGLIRDVVEHQLTFQALVRMSDEEFEAKDRASRERYEAALAQRREQGFLPELGDDLEERPAGRGVGEGVAEGGRRRMGLLPEAKT
jgi:hypothetical protein